VTPDFVDNQTRFALAAEAERRWVQQEFRAARIGTGASLHTAAAIRGDSIAWIDDSALSPAQAVYVAQLEQLRQTLNRELFLGAFDLELHFARYPVGAFYSKHLDRHAHTQARVVSCILYLNQAWQREDGGQLRIYTRAEEAESHIDITPLGGTLVTFLSGDFYHEVLPARQPRLSITGWMRARV
jgi:SM-20-related protein